jgi:hypothetical protein
MSNLLAQYSATMNIKGLFSSKGGYSDFKPVLEEVSARGKATCYGVDICRDKRYGIKLINKDKETIMLVPLLLGLALVASNVVVETFTVTIVVLYIDRTSSKHALGTKLLRDSAVMAAAMVLMFVGHLVQIAIWAIAFKELGEFESFRTALYHATVNFTTLGYGDIVMGDRWRLLGAIEAGAGMLMFGVSTAMFFPVLSKIFHQRLQDTQKHGH